MRKNDVTIGCMYQAKVSGEYTTVKIIGPHMHGGWAAINEATGRLVQIRTAARLTPIGAPTPRDRLYAEIRARLDGAA